jgi:FKBP-type peptidyl-prolyl cis-trans isomerase (trigger factor)
VVIPASEVRDGVERRLSAMGQSLRLPGFRPGKIPMSVLRERYDKSVREAVVQGLVAESAEQVVRERGLRPALQPRVTVTPGAEAADLEYTMVIELLPEIPAIDPAGLALTRLVVEPGEGTDRAELARLVRAHMKRQVLDQLAERYTFALPEGLVAREFAAIWKGVERELRREASPDRSEAELRADFRAIAERRVRLGLLLAEVARLHGITVKDEDLDRAPVDPERRPRPQAGAPPTPRAKGVRAQWRSARLEDAVVDFLIGRATVRERPASPDELARQGDAQAHAAGEDRGAAGGA